MSTPPTLGQFNQLKFWQLTINDATARSSSLQAQMAFHFNPEPRPQNNPHNYFIPVFWNSSPYVRLFIYEMDHRPTDTMGGGRQKFDLDPHNFLINPDDTLCYGYGDHVNHAGVRSESLVGYRNSVGIPVSESPHYHLGYFPHMTSYG